MKPSNHKTSICVACACGLYAVTGIAIAQERSATDATTEQAAPAASTLSFNAGLTSDYRYRGISQSRLKPAVSAGADYAHTSGLYVGTWLTTIQWIKDAGGNAPLEWDIYGGYKGTLGSSGIGYDVGLLRYQYPRNRLAVSANTTEVYGALTYGVFTAKYSHALTNLFGFADSQNSGYLDLSANLDLGGGWSVVPHVGRQWVRHNSAYAYTDYGVALNKDFGNGLSASAALIGTNADKALYTTPAGRFTGHAMLVAGIKYSF